MSGIQQWLIASYKATPSVTYATWNPSDKHADLTLSWWNLVATHWSVVNWESVRSTIWKSSGKWYWEIVKTSWSGSSIMMVGLANSTFDVTANNYIWTDANWYWYWWQTGQKIFNNSFQTYGASYATWDVIGVALDMDNWTITMYKNNTSQWTMYTWITWTIYACCSSLDNWWVFTANFWATTMAYTAPSWYNQWLYN